MNKSFVLNPEYLTANAEDTSSGSAQPISTGSKSTAVTYSDNQVFEVNPWKTKPESTEGVLTIDLDADSP